MSVQGIGHALTGSEQIGLKLPAQDSGGSGGSGGFKAIFKELVNEANQTSVKSDELVNQMARGEPTDIHSVMLAMTEADLSFRMLVEVRNRLVDAYQEIQRMPV
ncbi:MAG: flagellar hook-basal body complex protein FliE [Planctomycetota bacterium]